MSDLRQKTLVSVRASCNPKSNTKVFARSAIAEFGVPFSFDRAEPDLTGAESLLGLLATDVAKLFSLIATKKRLIFDRIEVTAKAELDASLAYLGVVGAEGTPSYQNFQVKVFVESAESLVDLQTVWNETTKRAPILNTLKKAADVSIEMVIAD